jgi:hypothetical protein
LPIHSEVGTTLGENVHCVMKKTDQRNTISTGLIWGPICLPLEEHVQKGDPLILLISPFIGLEALKRFLMSAGAHHGIKIVVRWRPEDLRSGVSDIEIYPYLAECGIPLYVNKDIHLKLYVFESNIAFSTSGNLTLRGFGYSENSNIEVGSFINIIQEDWARIYKMINTSKQVNEDMYQQYKKYVEACPKLPKTDVPPPDFFGTPKAYTISSLPAVETPATLAEYYFSSNTAMHSAEVVRRVAHDLVTFCIPPKLNQNEVDQQLGDSFRRTPFVVEFIEVLKAEKSLRFGAVNDWIHQKCEDVPLPYKWEIKENTRIFYNWLEHFFPEITWDRPNYSQVIHWQGK